jgi:hypothetical protein
MLGPMADHTTYEPDLGPLLVFGGIVIVGLGAWGGSRLFEALRARRQPAGPAPAAPPPEGSPPVA